MTELEYFKNTYQFTSDTTIVKTGENEFGKYIILDKTIFYPQGGGQPSDVGIISNSNFEFRVNKCNFVNNDVYHFGEPIRGEVSVGDVVVLKINGDERSQNARNHTAGHVIDLAINSLGLILKAVKGFHFPQGPYVEYEGDMLDTSDLISKIQSKLDTIVSENPKISFQFLEDLHKSGKPNRIMLVDGHPSCPCGGTHVDSLSRIKQIKIRKIKQSGNLIKISYETI